MLLGVAALGARAEAGELVDHAARAEQLLQANKPVPALAEIEAAFNSVWDKAGLGFSEALFVTSPPAGFGLYTPRATAAFHDGEPMHVYAEPFGYGFAPKDGQFAIALSADFRVRNAKGQVLQEQKGFADLTTVSRRRNKEFQVSITYQISGLKPGDYILATTLNDRTSGKSGSFELPFSIMK